MDFVFAEDKGEAFPKSVRESKAFKEYMKSFKKLV